MARQPSKKERARAEKRAAKAARPVVENDYTTQMYDFKIECEKCKLVQDYHSGPCYRCGYDIGRYQ